MFLRIWLVKFSTLFERFVIWGCLNWIPNNRAVYEMLPTLPYNHFRFNKYINPRLQHYFSKRK